MKKLSLFFVGLLLITGILITHAALPREPNLSSGYNDLINKAMDGNISTKDINLLINTVKNFVPSQCPPETPILYDISPTGEILCTTCDGCGSI